LGRQAGELRITSASNSPPRCHACPIFGLVARLVHQKGIDLVLSATDEIIDAGGTDYRDRQR